MRLYTPFSNCHTIQQLTITLNHSPSLLSHQQTCTVCLTINTLLLFLFKGPFFLIYHHLYCSSALCHTPYALKILYFKFIFSLSNLFHLFSHLIKFHYFTATFWTYKNPCIQPYKIRNYYSSLHPLVSSSFYTLALWYFRLFDLSTHQ